MTKTESAGRRIGFVALVIRYFGLAALACSAGEPALPLQPARVLSTTQRTTTTLVRLRTEAETIVTTREHPFARVGDGWTPAGALRIGDQIRSPKGTTRIVEVTPQRVPSTPVYNLTIAKTHAYFVGRDALLVHNLDCRGLGPSHPQSKRDREIEERARQHREAVERDAQELRIRRLLAGQRRRFNRLNLNDSHGEARTINCTSCSLTLLSDGASVREFVASTSSMTEWGGRLNSWSGIYYGLA